MAESLVPPVVVEPTTTVVPEPVAVAAPVHPSRICGFCQCTLDSRGGVLKRGGRVQEFLDYEDKMREMSAKLRKTQDDLDRTLADLGQAKAELTRYKSRKFGEALT